MKIAVLSGSPKGKGSVTLRYVDFLQLHHPEADFKVLHIGQQIHKLEKNGDHFAATIQEIEAADAVLWATPVYYMLVPAQLKRFIELVHEQNCVKAFSGKPAAAVTTSIHFFDHTAIRYLQAVSEDLGLSWQGAYPAEMNDLVRRKERARFLSFGSILMEGFKEGKQLTRQVYHPAGASDFIYRPTGNPLPVDSGEKRVTLIADLEDRYTNLAAMIGYLKDCFGGKLEYLNLADQGLKAGCRGCLLCGAENRCFYENRDNFFRLFEDLVRGADLLIFAGEIKDRFLSARFKLLMDRSFYLNHVPYYQGKQVGFLISGPLRQNTNLRDILESYAAMHQGNLVGIVTDEVDSAEDIDRAIAELVNQMVKLAHSGYLAPIAFPAAGGRKIFRDFIAGPAQLVFPADYSHYRRNRFFDYPQRKKMTQAVVKLLRNLLKIPRIRREFNARMNDGMVEPLDRVLKRERENMQADQF